MFIQLFNDIRVFIIRKIILMIFLVAQCFIFYNQYNLYNENKKFETLAKIAIISNPYQRVLEKDFPKYHNEYDFIFDYYNDDLKKVIQGWISNKYFQGNLYKKIEIYYITYENGFADEKLVDDVKNQLSISYILTQCSLIIIIYFIFALLFLFSWSKNEGFKKEYFLWLWELFIGKFDNLNKNKRIPYTIKNFKIAFNDIWQYLKSKKIFRFLALYIILNPLLNLSFLLFGTFNTQKIEDSSFAQNLKIQSDRYLNTLEINNEYIHVFKEDKNYFLVISEDKKIKNSYFGMMYPSYDYALRVSWEYENSKEKLLDIIKNLNSMSFKEFSYIEILIYPSYLPLYKYNNENRIHPQLAYFRDMQNLILKEKE